MSAAFSFSSSWCDPEWRPRQEPGTLPCDKAPTCKPRGEQDLSHKVGELVLVHTWSSLQANPKRRRCTKQTSYQNFPLTVCIIISLLCLKRPRHSHAPHCSEHFIQVCLYNGLSHTHAHTNSFIRGRGLVIQRTFGACMDMHIYHRSIRVLWPVLHNELNMPKVSQKVCSEYLITVRGACFPYKILICSPSQF